MKERKRKERKRFLLLSASFSPSCSFRTLSRTKQPEIIIALKMYQNRTEQNSKVLRERKRRQNSRVCHFFRSSSPSILSHSLLSLFFLFSISSKRVLFLGLSIFHFCPKDNFSSSLELSDNFRSFTPLVSKLTEKSNQVREKHRKKERKKIERERTFRTHLSTRDDTFPLLISHRHFLPFSSLHFFFFQVERSSSQRRMKKWRKKKYEGRERKQKKEERKIKRKETERMRKDASKQYQSFIPRLRMGSIFFTKNGGTFSSSRTSEVLEQFSQWKVLPGSSNA